MSADPCLVGQIRKRNGTPTYAGDWPKYIDVVEQIVGYGYPTFRITDLDGAWETTADTMRIESRFPYVVARTVEF